MRLPEGLAAGTFTLRRNRFVAEVRVAGRTALAHVPNSGRMRELLVPGARVLLQPAPAGSARRTGFTLVLVKHQRRWIGVDSRLPPALVVEAWRRGLLPALASYRRVRREVRSGGSRLDLCFDGPEGECYVEAKSVNLVVDGTALFPDAPTTRGARHLEELVQVVKAGGHAAVLFVVQRDDASALVPFESADPRFAATLRWAAGEGVGVYAVACRVRSSAISPRRLLPVWLGH